MVGFQSFCNCVSSLYACSCSSDRSQLSVDIGENKMVKRKQVIQCVVLCAALSCSVGTHALPVFELPDNFDRDGDPLVEAAGLEWLRWDITNGMSIDQALDIFGGWRLASNNEMNELFNESNITNGYDYVFDGGENDFQVFEDLTARSTPFEFFKSLGLTSYYCPDDTQDDRDNILQGGCDSYVSALYGADLDGDGLYNRASFLYNSQGIYSATYGILSSDSFESSTNLDLIDWRNYASGVALVRDISVTPVPVPASLGMFGAALFALGIWRRKLKSAQ